MIKEHGNGIYCYDLMQGDTPMKSSGFIVHDKETILIESGMAPSLKHILKTLDELSILPESLSALIITHVHLDHAGCAGVLAREFPHLKIMAHPKAVKHLINPDKLIEDTQRYFNVDVRQKFGPILPIKEDRIIAIPDKTNIAINTHRSLLAFETPGHSYHHLSLYDEVSKSVFMGDVAGNYYRNLFESSGIELCIPNAGPPHFNPQSMTQSIKKILDYQPEQIFYTHFGKGPSPQKALEQTLNWLKMYTEESWSLLNQNSTQKHLEDYYLNRIIEWARKQGAELSQKEINSLNFYNQMNARGVIHYYKQYVNPQLKPEGS